MTQTAFNLQVTNCWLATNSFLFEVLLHYLYSKLLAADAVSNIFELFSKN